MRKSIVNPEYTYDSQQWVVSLVNSVQGTAGKIGGHAVIVVEGQNPDGSIFQGEYDITANSFPQDQDPFQSMLGNVMGHITKIRCNPEANMRQSEPSSTAVFHRDYSKLSSRSWEKQAQLVLQMISSIEHDAQVLESEISAAQAQGRNINWPFSYQKAGSKRFTLLGGNAGENCITWAEKKLVLAGIGSSAVLTDCIKALPEKHIWCAIS